MKCRTAQDVGTRESYYQSYRVGMKLKLGQPEHNTGLCKGAACHCGRTVSISR